MRKLALVVLGCAPVAFGQAVVEKAAMGAAGATSGAVAGKGILGVFQNIDKTMDKAGGGQPAKPAPKPAAAPASSGDLNNLGSGSAARRSNANLTPQQRLAQAKAEAAGSAVAAPVENPPVVVADVTIDQLKAIEKGLTRADLLAKLGNPSMKMALPGDGGKELEIYRYRSGGKDAGVVQLLGGVVSSVEILNP